MAGHDYTQAERQRRARARKKASGLVEVRDRVPSDLAPELKRIAAEMRDPVKAEIYRQRLADFRSGELRHEKG